MEKIDVACECAQTELTTPDGGKRPAWVVTAEESEGSGPDRVVFSGPHAADRAVEYARARYERCNFRMQADPGRIGTRGKSLNAN